MKKAALLALSLLVFQSVALFAAQTYRGLDFRSWRPVHYASSTVDESGFSGLTERNPYFITPPDFALDASENPRLELLMESQESYFVIYFGHAGENLSEAQKLAAHLTASQMTGEEPVIIDCSAHAKWQGTITQMRLDIGLYGDNQVKVHQALFREASSAEENLLRNGDFSWANPHDTSRPLGWEGAGTLVKPGLLELAPGEEIVSPAIEAVPDDGMLYWSCTGTEGLTVEIRQMDLYGALLFSSPFQLDALSPETGLATLRLNPECATVRFALRNEQTEDTLAVSSLFAQIKSSAEFWQAKWIWAETEDPFARVVLRKKFIVEDLSNLTAAQVQVTADDELTLRLNGRILPCPNAKDWRLADCIDVTDLLRVGENFVEAYVVNTDTYGGLLGEVDLLYGDGSKEVFFTDKSWEYVITGVTGNPGPAAKEAFETSETFRPAVEQGPAGCAPWGKIPAIPLPRLRAKLRNASLIAPTYTPADTLALSPELYDCRPVIPGQAIGKLAANIYLENGKLQFPIVSLEKILDSTELPTICLFPKHEVSLRYLPEGEWTVRLEIPGVLSEDPLVMGRFTLKGQAPHTLSDTKLLFRNGIPYFLLNGTEEVLTDHCLLDMTASPNEYAEESNLLANGVKGVWLHYREWKYSAETDTFSFAPLDRLCTRVLMRDPQANFVVCVEMSGESLKEWMKAHDKELCRVFGDSADITNYSGTKSHYPSLASQAWLDFGDKLLAALVEHLREVPYGARVIGLAPSSGITWEWMYWGSQHANFCDYSRPFLEGFRTWLCNRYENDLASLRKAWQNDSVDFETAELPTPEERMASGVADLHDPVKSRKVIDFQDYFSYVVSSAIIHYCDTVKRLTDNKLLAGIYYGYTSFVLSGSWIPRIGHFALARVLDAPSVDFHISPTRYSDRDLGGAGGYMPPEASARLRDKLYVCESDIRTVHAATNQFGKVPTLLGTRAVLEREMGADLASGVSPHWYDFSLGWIGGDPRLAKLAGKLQAAEEELRTADPPLSVADDRRDTIAVFIDERSHVTQVMDSPLAYLFSAAQYAQLYRSGAKIDQYLFTDLPKVGHQYQCLVFLNAWRLTEEDLQLIETLKRPGRTMLFQYGVGITTENGVTTANTARILELPFAMEATHAPRQVTLTPDGQAFFGQEAPATLQCPEAYGPLFTPELTEDDTRPEVLGTLPDGRPALVRLTSLSGCQLFFCALPNLPGSWLAEIARTAGVTVYDDNHRDVVWAGQNALTIHTLRGGPRKLSLPFAVGTLKNLISGEEYPVADGVCTITVPDNSTTILRIIPKNE